MQDAILFQLHYWMLLLMMLLSAQHVRETQFIPVNAAYGYKLMLTNLK